MYTIATAQKAPVSQSIEKLFWCFDHSSEKYQHLENDGLDVFVEAGDSFLDVLSRQSGFSGEYVPLRVSKEDFLNQYHNWAYTWKDDEDGFADRLKDATTQCYLFGFPGVAVHTVYKTFRWDYHVLYCATEAMLIAAYEHELEGACEHYVFTGSDFLDPKLNLRGILSRGKWYDSSVYAFYDACAVVSASIPDEKCVFSEETKTLLGTYWHDHQTSIQQRTGCSSESPLAYTQVSKEQSTNRSLSQGITTMSTEDPSQPPTLPSTESPYQSSTEYPIIIIPSSVDGLRIPTPRPLPPVISDYRIANDVNDTDSVAALIYGALEEVAFFRK